MATRLALIRNHSPLAALEQLPGWWRGKADTRLALARDALARGEDKVADEHLRIASEYERRIKTYVQN
jgi:ATP phosphoribosyltransferase